MISRVITRRCFQLVACKLELLLKGLVVAGTLPGARVRVDGSANGRQHFAFGSPAACRCLRERSYGRPQPRLSCATVDPPRHAAFGCSSNTVPASAACTIRSFIEFSGGNTGARAWIPRAPHLGNAQRPPQVIVMKRRSGFRSGRAACSAARCPAPGARSPSRCGRYRRGADAPSRARRR